MNLLPLTLIYQSLDRKPVTAANRDRIYWYGEMSFDPHLWDLLGAQRIEVSVKIHSKIETSRLQNGSRGRKQLSQACYDDIGAKVTVENEGTRETLTLIPPATRSQPS